MKKSHVAPDGERGLVIDVSRFALNGGEQVGLGRLKRIGQEAVKAG